jgi:hypothetical protein
MIYAAGYGLYVPVFYVLLQSKKEATYDRALEGCYNASDKKMRATTFTSDFELAIINSMANRFPTATPVGCLFHWKQAIRRKALEFHIPKELISHLIGQNGIMNILTVIPVEEILSKGIPYCRSRTIETSYQKELDHFWAYFEKTWLRQYDPRVWNIHYLKSQPEASEVKIIQRTNNPLERFNRRLNDSFESFHPSMCTFVDTIRKISEDYVNVLHRISHNTMDPPVHLPPTMYQVSEEYVQFVPLVAHGIIDDIVPQAEISSAFPLITDNSATGQQMSFVAPSRVIAPVPCKKRKSKKAALIVNAGFPQGMTHVPVDIVPQAVQSRPSIADDGSGPGRAFTSISPEWGADNSSVEKQVVNPSAGGLAFPPTDERVDANDKALQVLEGATLQFVPSIANGVPVPVELVPQAETPFATIGPVTRNRRNPKKNLNIENDVCQQLMTPSGKVSKRADTSKETVSEWLAMSSSV